MLLVPSYEHLKTFRLEKCPGALKTVMAVQHQELVKLFQNLESLDLRQPTNAAFQDYQSRFGQLKALTRLQSLKLHWNWSWGSFALSQVHSAASSEQL